MEEKEIRARLYAMEQDKTMHTTSGYTANTDKWPDNQISFTEKHLAYIKAHPALNPEHYLSNLRLKIKHL